MLSRYSKWNILRRKWKLIQWDKPMPRPEVFDIVFDEPVYFAEQIITGSVVLEISEPLNLKGIKMRFKGECSLHFSKTKRIIRRNKKRKRKHENKREEIEKETKELKDYSQKHTSYQNGYCNGNAIENPGYIPDDESRYYSDSNHRSNAPYSSTSGSLPSNSSVNPRKNHYRPKSTESTWNEGTVKGPRQHFQAIETYFDCEFYIYGHKYQKDEKELLPAGRHDFPFSFNLPPNLPPSFSSERGIIRYMVAAVLDRPVAANLVRKAGFTVLSILDLNLNSHALSSCNKSTSINVCGLCCDKGPITLSVHVPRKGYVPGESIIVSAEVDNISGRHTKRTKLTLVQVITFLMPNDVKTHTEEKIIKEIVRGTLPPGESDFWEDVSITVPPLPPNNLHIHCRLMHIRYKLQMVVELPKPWKDLEVEIPIIIGNIPLRNTFSSFLPPKGSREQAQPALPGLKYPDFPSYSFGKCFYGDQILEEQYERITGDAEYMGPPYIEKTLYSPTFLVYNPGNNVSRSTSSSFDIESTVTS